LILFILAMAFPAASMAYFKALPRMCCGMGAQQNHSPPEEIGRMDEPTSGFQLCTNISSASMGSVAFV
jgi:hypothetical protein